MNFEVAVVASCLKYYHHLMLQIVGTSSLAQAIDSLDEDENRGVRKEVYAYSGLSLNFRNIFYDKKAISFINLPRNCNKNIVLWHDLINNSITDHKNNDGEPLSPAELISVLRSIPNLYAIIYCHRWGATNIFEHLLELNITVIDITKHILTKTEQINNTIKANFKKLHQSHDQELRSLAVVLHYYPRLKLILRQRSKQPKPSKSRRRAKQNEQ